MTDEERLPKRGLFRRKKDRGVDDAPRMEEPRVPTTPEEVQAHPAYREAETRASDVAADPEKLHSLIERARTLAASDRARGQFGDTWEQLQTALRMLKAYARREYTEIPYQTLVMLIAAVGYFLTPVDIIPDVLLGLGFLDDAAVFGFALKKMGGLLQAFRLWEQGRSLEEGSASRPLFRDNG